MSELSAQQAVAEAVEFKGRMLTLSVLKLNSSDLEQTEKALAAKVQRAADFFRNMPVLLDVAVEGLDLAQTAGVLRQYGLVPVAVFQPGPQVAEQAVAAGLGIIDDPRAARKAESAGAQSGRDGGQGNGNTANRPQAQPRQTAKVVTEPVRSGQQVYARGGDLVVLGAVSPGAEVLADGNIHVYGALRGRALAGVQGDQTARIFCRQLSAELVSVAGCYKISEDINPKLAGRAAHIYLEGERLEIASL